MTPLVIVGAGGHGREVLDVVQAVNATSPTFEFLGFLDDGAPDKAVLDRRNVRILGTSQELAAIDAEYLIGIGSPEVRRRIDRQATSCGRRAAIAIHPAATLGSDIRIGPGAVITAGSRLTTNIFLGRHVHVNINSTISHDCSIADYVTINPGANVSGGVTLEEGVTLGTGSAVIQGVRVGHNTMVGAGAVVVRDLPPGIVAVGIPAKPSPTR
jgi:sugar O-acyltransferase (sialic acid O-acetyltransferase NeuD family)